MLSDSETPVDPPILPEDPSTNSGIIEDSNEGPVRKKGSLSDSSGGRDNSNTSQRVSIDQDIIGKFLSTPISSNAGGDLETPSCPNKGQRLETPVADNQGLCLDKP
jgi:hypothetical protein